MVHFFKVQIYDFTCEGLVTTEQCDPYLKIDFDNFKLFKTDVEENNNSPEWSFKAGFHYKVQYLEKLAGSELRIQCFNRLNSKIIGEASIDLQTVVCGPARYELTLRDSIRERRGTLKFCCTMKMLSPNLTVSCQDLQLKMQGFPAPARLTISSTLSEDVRGVDVPHSNEGVWQGPFDISFETALGDLLKAPNLECLVFVVFDEMGVRQGEAHLEFRKAFTTKENVPIPFKVPVTYTCTVDGEVPTRESEPMGAVGELDGVVLYHNLPVYAQMAGGICVDGQIEGGFWLYEGLPYPRVLQQPPPLWQEHFETLSTDPDAAHEDQGVNFDAIDDKWVYEALEKIDLPPPWEKRRERVGDRCGRCYFVDPRSKRTTWKDPRFLPEGWECKIDPQSGKVYFQYHKTRQTTFVDPRSCPSGWDMRLSRNGEIYFAYLPAMKTTFIDPRGLPDNVDAALDDYGRMYFKNHEMKSTTWDDPRVDQPEVTLTKWRQAQSMRWWKEQVWREIDELNRRAEAEVEERTEALGNFMSIARSESP